MKYVKIFILHLQETLTQRMRAVVWFLLAFINSSVMLLYWRSAVKPDQMIGTWDAQAFQTYYIVLFFMSVLMLTHNELFIGVHDIKNGFLSAHLMRPVNYVYTALCREMPSRFIQGLLGLAVVAIFALFGLHAHFKFTALQLVLILCMIGMGILVSFFLKGLLGSLAFWFTETRGFTEMFDVLELIFAGLVLPIDLLPPVFKEIALVTPFPYILYYPAAGLTGQLTTEQMILVLFKQTIIATLLYIAFQRTWSAGVKKYTGIGQ